jgi:hypothetical protein
MILEITDDNLFWLEETIKENAEWLYTTDNDEAEFISIENIQTILSKFISKKVDLKER